MRGLRARRLERARRVAEQLGFLLSVHAPALDLNPLSPNREVRELTLRQYLRAAELACALGARSLTVHLGAAPYPSFPGEEARRLCIAFFAELADRIARQGGQGLLLALENAAWGARNPFPAVEHFEELAVRLDSAAVGFTLDLGHAHLAGLDVPCFVRRLAHRILNVHVHDNDGREDWHWPPGCGTVPFGAAAVALAEVGFGGLLVYECANQPPHALEFADRWARYAQQAAGG